MCYWLLTLVSEKNGALKLNNGIVIHVLPFEKGIRRRIIVERLVSAIKGELAIANTVRDIPKMHDGVTTLGESNRSVGHLARLDGFDEILLMLRIGMPPVFLCDHFAS